MAIKYFDRVKDTTDTTGVGAIALSGSSPTGFRPFNAVMTVSDTFYYCISETTGQWEIGIGTYTASNTFSRTTVKSSSDGGSLVNFGAGTKDVFLTVAAELFDHNVLTDFEHDYLIGQMPSSTRVMAYDTLTATLNTGSTTVKDYQCLLLASASYPMVSLTTATHNQRPIDVYPSGTVLRIHTGGNPLTIKYNGNINFGMGFRNVNYLGEFANEAAVLDYIAAHPTERGLLRVFMGTYVYSFYLYMPAADNDYIELFNSGDYWDVHSQSLLEWMDGKLAWTKIDKTASFNNAITGILGSTTLQDAIDELTAITTRTYLTMGVNVEDNRNFTLFGDATQAELDTRKNGVTFELYTSTGTAAPYSVNLNAYYASGGIPYKIFSNDAAMNSITINLTAGQFLNGDLTSIVLQATQWIEIVYANDHAYIVAASDASLINNSITQTSTNTFTNKILNSSTNYIDADALHTPVFNNAGGGVTALTALHEVQWNGAHNCPEVNKAIATSIHNSASGVAESNISNGLVGSMRTHGLLTGVDTSIWSEDVLLYLSDTVAGGLTATEPTTVGQIRQVIGRVVKQGTTDGVIAIRIGEPTVVSAGGGEPPLGNPTSDYLVLASTVSGSRLWVERRIEQYINTQDVIGWEFNPVTNSYPEMALGNGIVNYNGVSYGNISGMTIVFMGHNNGAGIAATVPINFGGIDNGTSIYIEVHEDTPLIINTPYNTINDGNTLTLPARCWVQIMVGNAKARVVAASHPSLVYGAVGFQLGMINRLNV